MVDMIDNTYSFIAWKYEQNRPAKQKVTAKKRWPKAGIEPVTTG